MKLRRNYLLWIRNSNEETVMKFGNINQDEQNPYKNTDGITDHLRMTFDINDTMDSKANITDINIYNMRPELRTELQNQRKLTAELLVSHDDEPLVRIFYGRISNINPTKSFPDMITTFNCIEDVQIGAFLNKSIQSNTKNIIDIIDLLKVELGSQSQIIWESPELKNRISGYPLENGQYIGVGFAQHQLDVLAREYEFIWNFNDGTNLRIYDLGKDQDPISNDYVEITPEDSVFGNPKIRGLNSTSLDLKLLLNNKLRAGRSIDIKALEKEHIDWEIGEANATQYIGSDIEAIQFKVRGRWRMHTINHFGDTHGNQWETTVFAQRTVSEADN